MDKKEVYVYIQFLDGIAKLLKIIQDKNGEIHICPPTTHLKWSIHKSGQIHLKKQVRKDWIEPEEEQRKQYVYIEHFDIEKLEGVLTIFGYEFLNGLSIVHKLKREHILIPLERGSKDCLNILVGCYKKNTNDNLDHFVKSNGVVSFGICDKTNPNIAIFLK